MNIKNKILSLAGIGATLSQLFASKALAVTQPTGWTSWLPASSFVSADLNDIVSAIIKWALTLAGVVAVVFIIYGGYQYITSSGDAEKAGKGRSTLINAIIGLVIIFIAYTLVRFLFDQIPS